jgi:hypothetical protein
MRSGLARVEQSDQNNEKHHVGGEEAEDGGAGAVQAFAGTPVGMLPLVVTAATPAARWAPIDWRLASGSRGFPFNL